MPVRFQKWITRQDLKKNPNVYYVFGDNTKRVGLGDQAKEMRGEPNAIGVATKWAPGWEDADFFKDDEASFRACLMDLVAITFRLSEGSTIVFPSDGLGTGLSMLPQKAPGLYKKLYDSVQEMCDETIPWEKLYDSVGSKGIFDRDSFGNGRRGLHRQPHGFGFC